MLRKKINIVVGITTFNTDMLKISIPAIARLASKFTLIIHNDNPAVTLSARQIRAMGYTGRLHVINAEKNVGLRAARLRILDAAADVARGAQWIIYADDDDILTSADIADVGPDNFAVIQNAVAVRRRISDLIGAAVHAQPPVVDGENVVLTQPHLGLRGTAVRTDVMRGLANIMHAAETRLDEIDASLDYRPPVDAMMWAALNLYARQVNPAAAPIYMDSVNYISNEIDTGAVKYGRPGFPENDTASRLGHAMARYDAAIRDAMHDAAAPRG